MEYKMGSCIGISHRQVNREGACLQRSMQYSACVTEQGACARGARVEFTGQEMSLYSCKSREREGAL